MRIGGLQKTSFLDYPHQMACVIFTVGCNFRCPFCHNKDLVDGEVPLILENEIFEFLEQRKNILEAVVVSGGEPTMQTDLVDFIKKIKKMGYKVKLDTNGSKPDVVEKLLKDNLLDYVAMDIKNDWENYEKTVGVKTDLEKIKKTIEILKKGKCEYEFRTTIVPTLHDKKNIENILKFITKDRLFLQRFRPTNCLNPEFNKLNTIERADLEGMNLGVKVR